MNSELTSTYTPKEVQEQIAERWRQANAFNAQPDAPGDAYAIVIPPPNVTAALHMGHALNNTLQDILIRYRRMAGYNTLWMPGTDHAGIATQTVVEKRVMETEGKRRTDFERKVFVEKIQTWKDEYETRITDQLKAMGCSCDWSRQRFTMDPICARAVREAFFRLFKDGLIYRGKRLVNWDPVTQTALADDEVEMQQVDGFFWYLKYPVCDEQGRLTGEHVTVATTRPETMLGDTAVAVNPHDTPRAPYIGQWVKLPIVDRIIPILGDDYVVIPDPDSKDEKARYASGFLKVTPAHDPNDWEIGRRHDLPIINVMAPDGTISNQHGWEDVGQGAFLLGLSREEARKQVVAWFEEKGLLEQVRPYTHSVGHSYRSHVPIEPYLSDQWYVKVTDNRLAGAALNAMAPSQRTTDTEGCVWKDGNTFDTDEGELRFYPARYAKTFQTWHENLRDWCISRQLWWGHQIPVWRGPVHGFDLDARPELKQDVATTEHEGELFVCLRNDDAALQNELEQAGFSRDPDVLDTWFSSALWPMSTLGWPNPEDFPQAFPQGKAALEKWNPSNTLCTAREIITLWVSRMVMFNLYFRNCLPFRDVFIHAMIQDGHGQKMSKSLGNGVDPFDIIHSHGADGMRFTLASMTAQTQDVRLPVDLVCPHTGQTFTPRYVDDGRGHKVAAPIQLCPGDKQKKMVSSYGAASGKATPTEQMPLARNTSEKFDTGRNFANKLWNAARFALQNIQEADPDAQAPPPGLADQWILSRLTATIKTANKSLNAYEFKTYADSLYDFAWRDVCDWYIESVKPTIRQNATQCRVLSAVLDTTLRLLHPVMPYLTEKIWEHLNAVCPDRNMEGLTLPPSNLLIQAAWPEISDTWQNPACEETFDLARQLIIALRQVRTAYNISPRQPLTVSAQIPPIQLKALEPARALLQTVGQLKQLNMATQMTQPDRSAVAVVGDIQLFVHDLVDVEAERQRLAKAIAEVQNSIKTLAGRLSNEKYTSKAPAHLVQQTRDQLAQRQNELASLQEQLTRL